MKKIFIFICLVSITILNSCYEPIFGTGEVIQYDRNLSDSVFWAVTHEGIGDVYITQGSPQKVIVETDENLINTVNTTVGNKKLTISTKKNIAPTVLDIYITIQDIAELKVSGAGNIIVENSFSQGSTLWLIGEGSGNIAINQFNANDCHITNEGSGNIAINQFNANDCHITNEGSGNVSIISTSLDVGIILDNFGSGNIKIEDISASEVDAYALRSGNITIESGSTNGNNLRNGGSGQIDVMGMSSLTADVTITNEGSGNIKLTVTEYLNAKIYGSGNIYYWGNPPNVDEYISGSGKLIRN